MTNFVPFKEVAHTADLAIQVFGKTLQDLFQNAYLGYYSISLNNIKFIQKLSNAISALKNFYFSEPTLEDLLVSFLNELNYYLQAKQRVFAPLQNLKLTQNDNKTLSFKSQLFKIDNQILQNLTEIKAITYHGMEIQKKNDLYTVTIIFDT